MGHSARRRADLQRMKSKAKRIYSRFGDHPLVAQSVKFANHLAICSCYGCGNQRKYEGPTMQERRMNEGHGG